MSVLVSSTPNLNLFKPKNPEGYAASPPAMRKKVWTLRILLSILILVLLAVNLKNYRIITLDEDAREMSPMYAPGDRVMLFQYPDEGWQYREGDILYVKLPERDGYRLLRLLAQDEGRVFIKGGNVFLNGNPDQATAGALPAEVEKNFDPLEKGEVFLIFDNQEGCKREDSLTLGAFDKDELQVMGKVFFNLSRL